MSEALQEEKRRLKEERERLLRELASVEQRLAMVDRSKTARRAGSADSDYEDLFDNIPV